MLIQHIYNLQYFLTYTLALMAVFKIKVMHFLALMAVMNFLETDRVQRSITAQSADLIWFVLCGMKPCGHMVDLTKLN